MIKKFDGFEEKANVTTSQLPAGCYVIKILGVKYVEGAAVSDKIEMRVDIEEGDLKGFFQQQFDASTDEDKRWKGKATIWLPDGSNSDADKRSVRNFNAFAAYLANANPGYHWDWNEQSLKGKKIGAAFRKEHNVFEGREVSYTSFAWFCDADEVRSGKAKTPAEKYRNGATGSPAPAAASAPMAEGFMSIPDTQEEDIPF